MDPDTDFKEIVSYLKDNLGLRITAYLSGLNSVRPLCGWQKRKRPCVDTEMRLRCAHQAVLLVIEAFGKDTAKAWLFGKNQFLDDRAPAWVLRRGKTIEDLLLVVSAAKIFVRR